LRVALGLVQVVGQHRLAGGVVLLPDLAAAGQRDGEAIAEAAHAAQRAEVLVEGAVFLHQDHHVLDVLDGAGLVVCGDRECLADAGREGGQRGGGDAGGGSALDESAAGAHGVVLVVGGAQGA
jgi:hypothetical protein